jgi:hypothetical protein
MQAIKAICYVFLSGALSVAAMADQGCSGIRNGELDRAVQYLKTQLAARTGSCIAEALDRMGDARTADGVEMLLAYLDYVRPKSAGIVFSLTSTRDAQYPAEAALEERGKVALPKLMELIGLDGEARPTWQGVGRYAHIW